MSSATSYLVLQRGGSWWGIADAAVRSIARRGRTFQVELGHARLEVDEIHGIVKGLTERPPSPAVGRYWGATVAGLAVLDGRPLVLIDPESPPAVMLGVEPVS